MDTPSRHGPRPLKIFLTSSKPRSLSHELNSEHYGLGFRVLDLEPYMPRSIQKAVGSPSAAEEPEDHRTVWAMV